MNGPTSEKQGDRLQKAIEKNREKGGVVQYERMQIGPEMAKEMLDRTSPNLDRVRSHRAVQRIVREYADAMLKEAWVYNAMPIIFDEEGYLVDGLQRLQAIVMAGVTLDTLVAFNVPDDARHTIDQHRRRTFSGILESRGITRAGAIIRMMSTLIRIENGELGIETYPIGWGRYTEVLEANPLLKTAAQIASAPSTRGNALDSSPRAVLAYMALEAGKRDEFEVFLKALKEDDVVEADSPAVILRNQLMAQRYISKDRSKGYSDFEQLALGILAFNDFLEGVSASRPYKWLPKYKKPGGRAADPTKRSELRERAPANLGLPQMVGYPGIRKAVIPDHKTEVSLMSGELKELLEQGARKSTRDSTTRMIRITPEMADQILRRFNTKNRNIQPGHVDMMARDIRNGRWMVNVQPICFTGDPLAYDYSDEPVRKEGDMRLLNGQHRLEACLKSGIPIEVPISTHVAEEAFATYDQQTRKGLSGMMGKEGLKVDARIAVAAARLQWRVDNGYEPTRKAHPTESEIEEVLEHHPDLTDGALESRDPGLLKIASGGIILFMVYHVRQDRPDLAEEFIEFLRTGIYNEEHPMISIRAELYGKRAEIHRLEVLRRLLVAWEEHKAFKDGKTGGGKPVMAGQEAFL